jgi:hypothetical protein
MVFDVGIRIEWFSIREFVSVATLVLISVSITKKTNIADWGRKKGSDQIFWTIFRAINIFLGS